MTRKTEMARLSFGIPHVLLTLLTLVTPSCASSSPPIFLLLDADMLTEANCTASFYSGSRRDWSRTEYFNVPVTTAPPTAATTFFTTEAGTTQPTESETTSTSATGSTETTTKSENDGETTTKSENEAATTTNPENEEATTTKPENEGETTTKSANEGETTTKSANEEATTTNPENEGATTTNPENEGETTTKSKNEGETTNESKTEEETTTKSEKEKKGSTTTESEGETTAEITSTVSTSTETISTIPTIPAGTTPAVSVPPPPGPPPAIPAATTPPTPAATPPRTPAATPPRTPAATPPRPTPAPTTSTTTRSPPSTSTNNPLVHNRVLIETTKTSNPTTPTTPTAMPHNPGRPFPGMPVGPFGQVAASFITTPSGFQTPSTTSPGHPGGGPDESPNMPPIYSPFRRFGRLPLHARAKRKAPKTPPPPYCRIMSDVTLENPLQKYQCVLRLKNEDSLEGPEYGQSGMTFNMADIDNFDFILLNFEGDPCALTADPKCTRTCVTQGVMSGGVVKLGKPTPCLTGFLKGQTEYTIRIKSTTKNADLLVEDVAHVVYANMTLKVSHPMNAFCGIMVAPNHNNVIYHRNFELKGFAPVPGVVED